MLPIRSFQPASSHWSCQSCQSCQSCKAAFKVVRIYPRIRKEKYNKKHPMPYKNAPKVNWKTPTTIQLRSLSWMYRRASNEDYHRKHGGWAEAKFRSPSEAAKINGFLFPKWKLSLIDVELHYYTWLLMSH